MPGLPMELRPIGVVRSDHAHLARTPRQPGATGEDRLAHIELHRGPGVREALRDLAGMERIWVLSWFHQVRNWRPMVLPPRGGRTRRGVFATRSPHRPNPLGLSLVRLLGIDGLVLHVADVDLLDGTPVLDLKPYLPAVEAHPASRAGWIDDLVRAEADGTAFPNTVRWSDLANEQREWLREHHGVDLAPTADVLRRDAAPHPYRRIERCDGGAPIAWRGWRRHFTHVGADVAITEVRSGYGPAALAAALPGTLVDDAAQREFAVRWPTDEPCALVDRSQSAGDHPRSR